MASIVVNRDYSRKFNRKFPLGTVVRVRADQWNKDRRPTTIVGVNFLGQFITQRKQGAPYKVYPAKMLVAEPYTQGHKVEYPEQSGIQRCRTPFIPHISGTELTDNTEEIARAFNVPHAMCRGTAAPVEAPNPPWEPRYLPWRNEWVAVRAGRKYTAEQLRQKKGWRFRWEIEGIIKVLEQHKA